MSDATPYTEEDREKAREWVQEHLTGPNSDPMLPGTGWPYGVESLARFRAEARAEAEAAGFRRGVEAAINAQCPMCDEGNPLEGHHCRADRIRALLTEPSGGGK